MIPDGIVIRGDTTVGRHRRRAPDHDGRRRALDRHRRRRRAAGTGPSRHGAAAAGERIRPAFRHRPPRVERHHAPGQPAALARPDGVADPVHRGGGLSAEERDPHRPATVSWHPVRSATDGRHAAVHPEERTRGRCAKGAPHRLAPPAHREDRQSVHRPDLPLRLDDGRVLPAAPGRRVQQPGWHARSWRRSAARVVYAGPAEAGREDDRHPARHDRHGRRQDGSGSTRSTTTTPRSP